MKRSDGGGNRLEIAGNSAVSVAIANVRRWRHLRTCKGPAGASRRFAPVLVSRQPSLLLRRTPATLKDWSSEFERPWRFWQPRPPGMAHATLLIRGLIVAVCHREREA